MGLNSKYNLVLVYSYGITQVCTQPSTNEVQLSFEQTTIETLSPNLKF